MYHLLKSNGGSFNIFCDEICDTTGTCTTIQQCFKDQIYITDKRYKNLQDFIERSEYKIVICSFKSKTFSAFKNEYPELFI